MILNILASLALLVSILLLGRIIWRRLPELKVLDLESIPKERKSGAKAKILENKFKRQSQEVKEKLGAAISPLKEKFSGLGQRLKDRATSLEKKYKKNSELEGVRSKSINELFAEAEKHIDEEEYQLAEKALIEILARDKKDLRAYELLGEVYRFQKSYDQAAEIIKYLIKLKSLQYRKNHPESQLKKQKLEEAEEAIMESVDVDSDVSRFYDDLGEIYLLDGKPAKSLDCYLKASAIEPNNPKYLDKIIGLAIEVNDPGLAKKTYKRLKEINPENAKLQEFKEALEKKK
ncbi:MAG: hypothetical protein BWY53_00362 [Parcubacteria group bacterium ADurb.Bin326]|nr:MAG: hypothetical protein BWY53_00362 [Parcubacteria group bacterium ADurb.Bin326]